MANITRTKQNRPRQIRDFNVIEIDDDDALKAEQRQVFQNLVAEGSRSDHQHFGGAKLLLVPPWRREGCRSQFQLFNEGRCAGASRGSCFEWLGFPTMRLARPTGRRRVSRQMQKHHRSSRRPWTPALPQWTTRSAGSSWHSSKRECATTPSSSSTVTTVAHAMA